MTDENKNVLDFALGQAARQAKQQEIISTTELPECPKWLSDAAAEFWPELVDELGRHKIINKLDRDVLAVYCSTLARYVEADRQVEEDGMTQATPNGYQQVTAAYVAWRDMAGQVLKYSRQLGLTPPARIAMKLTDPNQTDLFKL